jgi:hypothetical protein
MLAACSVSVTDRKPTLPAAPAGFGEPVPVPVPRAGQDARAVAARAYGALRQANGRLEADRAFYDDVLTRFSEPGK